MQINPFMSVSYTAGSSIYRGGSRGWKGKMLTSKVYNLAARFVFPEVVYAASSVSEAVTLRSALDFFGVMFTIWPQSYYL